MEATYKFTIAERDEVFTFERAEPEPVSFELAAPIQIVSGEEFPGPYEATPTAEAQTLNTAGYFMSSDIIINPIPNNYGLITWNGSTLTVS